MSCQGRWPCCCNRASQCLGCDSDPTGGEYDYVVLVRFGGRESSTYDSTTGKYLPDFDFSSPERFLSLKLNGQDLPIPHLIDRSDYNNDYYYYWYWNYHYYGWAVYYTNPNVLGPIANATRCPCLGDVTTLYGWTYYWLYSGWYSGPQFLTDPSTQYIPISKGAFQANNNNMDLRFSSLPFNLDEWPTENPLKTAKADVDFVVIRFKNGIPECVSAKNKLTAEIRSQEYDYSSNGNWYYWWWGGYWALGVGGGYLPGSNQTYGTPANCSWPFPRTTNYYGYWSGWYGGYTNDTNLTLDKYWGFGGHTYFDLCAYEQDSIPPCAGNLPGTLNVTIVTKCLGTQTAQVSAATPVYYDYENTQPIPYTYTNCGNFTQIQANNSTYYLFAYAGYKQPYYNQNNLAEQLKDCSFPLSTAEASYYLINKTNRANGFIDLGIVPGAEERQLTIVDEFFIDDEDYFSEPQNPVIPDIFRYPDGSIIPRTGIIQSWKIGDPYDYYYYYYYYNIDYDYYFICEDGDVSYKNKHDNITYHDWPMTIKDQPIICNPFVTGPSLGNSFSRNFLSYIPIVTRFELADIIWWWYYLGRKTAPAGSYMLNGKMVKLKYRPWKIYGVDHIWSTNCHSCPVGYRTAHPPITVTP
jgi:hypothetical protein